jgi:hypothetical protein
VLRLLLFVSSLACTKVEAPKVEQPPQTLAEHAERLGRKITDQGARALLIAELGAAFVRAGRPADAKPYLEEAEQNATSLADPSDRESVFAALANAQALAGDIEKAKQTAKQIAVPDTRSEALTEIVEQIAARKDLAAARSLVAAIPEEEWRASAEVHLVKAILAGGKTDEAGKAAAKIGVPARRDEATSAVAIALFESGNNKLAEGALNSIESPHWRAEAVAATARLAYQRGAHRRAIERAKGIESHWIRARTYAELSGMAARAGRTSEARRLLEQGLEFAEDIKDQVMRATALTDIAMRLIDRGHVDEAGAVLAKAPQTATRYRADAHLAGYYAQKGEMTKANQVQQSLSSDLIWGSEAASQIARAHSARQEFKEALEAAARIKTRELRLPALAEIAVKHTLAGAPVEESIMSQLEGAIFGTEI